MLASISEEPTTYLPKNRSAPKSSKRIQTILRRSARSHVEPATFRLLQGILRVGDLMVDTNRRQVSPGPASARAHLHRSASGDLSASPADVVPRAEILEQLWGYPTRRAADLRVVDG